MTTYASYEQRDRQWMRRTVQARRAADEEELRESEEYAREFESARLQLEEEEAIRRIR